jgi:hypothetical protein
MQGKPTAPVINYIGRHGLMLHPKQWVARDTLHNAFSLVLWLISRHCEASGMPNH